VVPHLKKEFKTQKSLRKVLKYVFWDRDGSLLVDCQEIGTAKMTKHYFALLDKLKHQPVLKRQAKLP
jgi:hypothetical protein